MQAELDRQFMQQAIEQAKLAAAAGEVPVGAVLVQDAQVISTGFNQPISNS
ncbi:MAG: tRNA-specific adenosine deaminase, partial [Polynucleobacter sp. 35-46-207]